MKYLRVVVLMVNNASRDRRVLKLVLVIKGIKKYFYILACHLTQPEIDKKLVLVIIDNIRVSGIHCTYGCLPDCPLEPNYGCLEGSCSSVCITVYFLLYPLLALVVSAIL
jgi:hypothetical protein